MPRSALARVLAFSLLTSGAVLSAAPLRQYCNPRYGYCAAVPADLTPLRSPDNGDGQAWRSRDGAVKVSVWGSYGPEALELRTPAAYAGWLKRTEQGDGSTVSYSFVGKAEVVLSGHTRAGQIFYQRVRLYRGAESALRTEYPPRLRGTWDTLSAQLAKTLTRPINP